MEAFLADLTKPSWWLSVILVGIFISLATSFIEKALGKSISSTSSWWRKVSKERSEKWIQYIKSLATDQNLLQQARHEEVRARLQSIESLLFASFIMLIWGLPGGSAPPRESTIGVLALASLFLIIAFITAKTAVSRARAIHEAISES